MKPFHEYESQQRALGKKTAASYAVDKAIWDEKRKAMSSLKTDDQRSGPTAEEVMQLKDIMATEPSMPKIPRLIHSDVTQEGLAKSLAEEWPSGGVISGEAGVVFGGHGMNSESLMRFLSFLNLGWDGTPQHVTRKTSANFVLEGARLTVGLLVQEPVLRKFLDTSDGLVRGIGFLARCLLAFPESTQGSRLYRDPPVWKALNAFHERVTFLLNEPVQFDANGSLIPELLVMSPAAKAAWVDYYNSIEKQLTVGGDYYDIRDVASKSADNAARIAALFHKFTASEGLITTTSMQSGIQIAEWHLREANRFLSTLPISEWQRTLWKLIDWLTKYCRQSGTSSVGFREALQRGPIRDSVPLENALTELVERGYARDIKVGKLRKIRLNPSLLTQSIH